MKKILNMKKLIAVVFVALLSVVVASAQEGAWLDAKTVKNWNKGIHAIPTAPKGDKDAIAQCGKMDRPATLAVDKLMTAKGWHLVGAGQVFGKFTIVEAAAGYDGMCRPDQFNAFVFSGTSLIGTLAPKLMSARTDGSIADFMLGSEGYINAEYVRYSDSDALCCPSRTTNLSFTIEGNNLKTGEASTVKNPEQ